MTKSSFELAFKATSFLLTALFLTLFFIILPVSPSPAATTLTVGPTLISANQPLTPGKSYTLPPYTITNGADQEITVQVSAFNYRDQERSLPPDSWFEFFPASLKVPAGESREVYVRVNLPGQAQPGNYRIWFRFHGSSRSDPAMLVSDVALYVSFVFDVRENHEFNISEPGRSPQPVPAYTADNAEPSAAESPNTDAGPQNPYRPQTCRICWVLAAATVIASFTLAFKLKRPIRK